MQIRMLKDGASSKIKNDIARIWENYLRSNTWVDEYFKENGIETFYLNTNLIVDDFELINGGPEFDAENSVIIHKAFKNLLPIQAREEKIWAYYTHTKCWNYMRTRWEINNNVKNPTSIIKSRYFFDVNDDKKIKIGTLAYVRNGISRLWWAAHIVYDDSLPNPYEYINEIFASQDLFVNISEREIAKNKKLTLAILKAVRKYDLRNANNSTNLFRKIIKEIRFNSALVLYDSMPNYEIEKMVNATVEKHLLTLQSVLIDDAELVNV